MRRPEPPHLSAGAEETPGVALLPGRSRSSFWAESPRASRSHSPGDRKKALPVRADSIAVIDTRTNRLVGDVPIDGRPVAIAADDKGVYVAAREGIVWRIDPATRRVVGRIGVSGDVHDLALGFGSVWLADGTDGTVTRIDDRLDRLSGPGRSRSAGVRDAPAFWITTDAARVGHAWRPPS